MAAIRNTDPALIRLYQLINEEEGEGAESIAKKEAEFKTLLDADPGLIQKGETLLYCAAMKGRSAYVAILLNKGADPYKKDRDHHKTPIDAAAYCQKHSRIAEYVKIFKTFVERGVNFFDYEIDRDESYTFGGTLVDRVLFFHQWEKKWDPGFVHHYKLIEVLVSNGAFSNTAFVRIKDRFEDFNPEQIQTIRNTIQAAKQVFEQRTGKKEPPALRGADGYDRRCSCSSGADPEEVEGKEETTPRSTGLIYE